ncbi:Oidioi.mRNA.OKI2018_I69.XSR.g16259.t1.cds [Oikopleura dioica]|uniref:Oidioi.mRNA.OKI2018_I69.PAR.g10452.t1.cds n=1 Tax=Oikopleura dioica TaxID=34765 RepID=A0ABN7RS47_OIKDI|nr:Oidioi.mRNA.OKI2018_I69.PAR.g10452.t1.cds [Oikopleura dioica]CAG5084815.1 Oidioi.mRNA.OKI2018_I69.PAR.g10743.t1.cds [Oikopleura dioica]CAG5099109.1 Oidioi.mRNA.OKI2018_I69.XSR.g16259.t1.cds [Oikopleura dioica]
MNDKFSSMNLADSDVEKENKAEYNHMDIARSMEREVSGSTKYLERWIKRSKSLPGLLDWRGPVVMRGFKTDLLQVITYPLGMQDHPCFYKINLASCRSKNYEGRTVKVRERSMTRSRHVSVIFRGSGDFRQVIDTDVPYIRDEGKKYKIKNPKFDVALEIKPDLTIGTLQIYTYQLE